MKKMRALHLPLGLLALLLIIAISLPVIMKEHEKNELSCDTIEIAEIPGTGNDYPGKEPALVIGRWLG